MRHFIDTCLESALWFAADWSLRWGVLLAVVALMLWIFRPRRAAVRQVVLLVGLIAGLLVPFAPRWGDGWERSPHLPEPSPPPSFPGSAWERTASEAPPRATPRESAPRQGSETPQEDARQSLASSSFPGRAWERETTVNEPLGRGRFIILGIVSCWALAVAYQLIRYMCGCFFLRRLRRESVKATETTADLFTACLAELHVNNAVRLAIHPHVRSPILIGWLRPCVLVPTGWPQRGAEPQRASFLHELAHVRRRDHLFAPLLEIIRIAFFFHPLVHWLLARLEHERELLCDEMVVRLGIDRRDYARLLLEFARSSGRLAWPAVSLPMSRRRTVKGRIYHLLEEDMERWTGPLPARWAVILGGGLMALSLGLASYRVWAVEKEKTEAPTIGAAQPPVPNKSVDPSIKREDLRYGGKDFKQWRKDMLTELKGSIRVDGIKAFAAFGTNGYGPEATQAILEIMRGYDVTKSLGDDSEVVHAGYAALIKIGAPALPALVQAVEGKNRNVRLFAINALQEMQSDARSAAPVLLKAMKNDDGVTRRYAMEALRVIDSHAKGYVPALIDALKDESTRSLATVRLGETGIVEAAKPAIPALLEELRDRDDNLRLNAIQTLNSIGPEKQGVRAVTQLLQDKNLNTRREAYTFLLSLGRDAKEAVPALIAVLKAPIGDSTQMAVKVLADIGPGAEEAVPALTDLLRNENYAPRQGVLNAIKQIRPNDRSRR